MASKVSGYIGKLNPGNGTQYSLGSTAYGYCETAASTVAKTVDMTGFTLLEGATVFIKFKEANSAANPTLNINSTGAKPIVQYGTTAMSTDAATTGWQAGAILCLTYDGTSWVRDQGYNTDTKVTSVDNHYTPSTNSDSQLSASASGASAAWSIDVVKGVQIQRDAKGHVTGVTVTSGKIPANPNTNTTYTIATGDANGQIKVTPSSGSAYNVDVKGLGTAAYQNDGRYKTRITGTKSLSTAGWYRILDCTTYSMAFLITFFGAYNYQPPTPVTFLVSHEYNHTSISQIGRNANIGWMTKIRAIRHDTYKFYIDIYYAGNNDNTCNFEVTPLDPNSRSSITKVDYTAITDELTSNAECSTDTKSRADKFYTARSLTTKLDSTTAVTFDGSADQNAIPVTGTLPIGNGGTGATTAAGARANLGTLGSKLANSYEGMTNMDGADDVWIRTTSQGIIPYQSGDSSAGHCGLGTSTWYFASAYVQNYYGGGANLINLNASNLASGTVANARLPARLQAYHTSASNDSTECGWYYGSCGSPFTKYHTSDADFMVWTNGYSGNWASEIGTDFRTNRLAVRNKNNGTWSAWNELASNDSIVNEFAWSSDIYYDAVNNRFTNTRGTDSWSSQIYSKHGFSTGCYISFRVEDTTHYRMVGLNNDPTNNANYNTIDYCWYPQSGGNLCMYENGTSIESITGHTTYAAGDDFRIEYSDGYIRYYHNGVLCRSVARAISGQLYADSSMYNGGTIVDLRFGPITAIGADGRYVNVTGDTMTGPLYINSAEDAGGTNSSGALIIGTKTGENIAIDSNEIMARKNSAVSNLYLNNDGGLVGIGSGGLAIASLTASQAVSTDANKKLVSTNLTVSDSTTDNGLQYVYKVTQGATGKITVSKSNIREASASQSGIVSTGTQTFAGEKTFSGNVNLSGETTADSLTAGNLQVNGSATFINTINGSINGNAATATGLASTGTTGQFWRGDNTWSNTLTRQSANDFVDAILKIDNTRNRDWITGLTQVASNMTAGNYVGFQIGKTSGTTNNVGHLSFYYAGDQSTSNRVALGFFNNINKLVVRADGNVGIDTASPSAKLHISGGVVKITNNSNTVSIGSTNSSWCHFENTANIPFYFNHQINAVDGFKVYDTNTSLTNNNLVFAQGGGWNMTDSTWIRAYGSKQVYIANTTDSTHSSSTAALLISGGLTVAKKISTKEVRIDNGQTSKGVSLQYNETLEVLNFVFS